MRGSGRTRLGTLSGSDAATPGFFGHAVQAELERSARPCLPRSRKCSGTIVWGRAASSWAWRRWAFASHGGSSMRLRHLDLIDRPFTDRRLGFGPTAAKPTSLSSTAKWAVRPLLRAWLDLLFWSPHHAPIRFLPARRTVVGASSERGGALIVVGKASGRLAKPTNGRIRRTRFPLRRLDGMVIARVSRSTTRCCAVGGEEIARARAIWVQLLYCGFSGLSGFRRPPERGGRLRFLRRAEQSTSRGVATAEGD